MVQVYFKGIHFGLECENFTLMCDNLEQCEEKLQSVRPTSFLVLFYSLWTYFTLCDPAA